MRDRELLFSAEHLPLILSGTKRLTIRLHRPEAHDFMLGERFVGVFPGGERLRLRATHPSRLFVAWGLPYAIAKEDGYAHAFDALRGLGKYYGKQLKTTSRLAVIRFELAPSALAIVTQNSTTA